MSSLRIPQKVFFVRSTEQNFCPCCGKQLIVIGSRRRKCINGAGETLVLVIRRLQCLHCGRVHHELPDLLVPYKRYDSDSIEAVLGGGAALTVAADESTLSRWRRWVSNLANHFVGCLASICIRYQTESVGGWSVLPQSVLPRIWHYVGNAPAWLARVVRPVANSNNWVQTRFAFLS